MEIDIASILRESPILVFFVVICGGLLVGRCKAGVVELGSTTGVLLVGLLFGHLGFDSEPILGTFGFTIFIFAVGLQAGPTFFNAFATDGTRYVILAVGVSAASMGLAVAAGRLIGLDYGMSAGLLAGALTSTPTLAGAQDALASGIAHVPDGLTADAARNNIGVAYAITYVFGTIGLILFIRYFPALFRIDLPGEALRVARERGFVNTGRAAASSRSLPLIRAYRVPAKIVGRSHAELRAARESSGYLLGVKRDGVFTEAVGDDFVYEPGDLISVVGSLAEHARARSVIGQEVFDPDLLDFRIVTKEIVIMVAEVAGKTIGELDLQRGFGCLALRLERASMSLPLDATIPLQRGDRLTVSGEAALVQKLADQLGRVDADRTETDLLTFSLGIGAGVLLGMVMIRLGGVSIGLGSAGGLLLLGILLGFLRSRYPTFGGVPTAARKVLMELGLVLFMASVGLNAGGGVVDGFLEAGPELVIAGIAVTLTPVVLAYLFGTRVLRMNPAILLGAITGSMTSTPSLNIVTDAAKSDVPALGYAGTYAFANVLLTFAGTWIMTI